MDLTRREGTRTIRLWTFTVLLMRFCNCGFCDVNAASWTFTMACTTSTNQGVPVCGNCYKGVACNVEVPTYARRGLAALSRVGIARLRMSSTGMGL